MVMLPKTKTRLLAFSFRHFVRVADEFDLVPISIGRRLGSDQCS